MLSRRTFLIRTARCLTIPLVNKQRVLALFLLSMCAVAQAWAHMASERDLSDSDISGSHKTDTRNEIRIVSLAPHLTEWVYSLGLGTNLVAVSDYSDYPEAAKALPRVADYQGVDMTAILSLQPDLVLAWKGGNKPQDIQKLSSLGLKVFYSAITDVDDIPSELIRLGAMTNTAPQAKALASAFAQQIATLRNTYSSKPFKPVFYYSWAAPLMTVGPNAWPNKLLNICGAQTAFYDSPVDYPQVSVTEVLKRQPEALVAASKESLQTLSSFWAPHREFLKAELITVDPDITSRFSLRLADELKQLCIGINS